MKENWRNGLEWKAVGILKRRLTSIFTTMSTTVISASELPIRIKKNNQKQKRKKNMNVCRLLFRGNAKVLMLHTRGIVGFTKMARDRKQKEDPMCLVKRRKYVWGRKRKNKIKRIHQWGWMDIIEEEKNQEN